MILSDTDSYISSKPIITNRWEQEDERCCIQLFVIICVVRTVCVYWWRSLKQHNVKITAPICSGEVLYQWVFFLFFIYYRKGQFASFSSLFFPITLSFSQNSTHSTILRWHRHSFSHRNVYTFSLRSQILYDQFSIFFSSWSV